MLGQWLDWTLDGERPSPRIGRFPSGTYHLHGPGVLELTPNILRPEARARCADISHFRQHSRLKRTEALYHHQS